MSLVTMHLRDYQAMFKSSAVIRRATVITAQCVAYVIKRPVTASLRSTTPYENINRKQKKDSIQSEVSNTRSESLPMWNRYSPS